MPMPPLVRRLLFFSISALVAFSGCSDESDEVTVTGVVMNVDTAEPAEGVRVSLLDGSASTDVATGSDGKYTLRVPRGTLFETITDDFESGATDWFPMINVDYPGIVLNDDHANAMIHACPSEGNLEDGSVAKWNYYLANCSDPTLPAFDAPSAEESGGILIVPNPKGSISGMCVNVPGIDIQTDHAGFPVAYRDRNRTDGCIYHPLGTHIGGLMWSIGPSSYPGGDIVVSAIDTAAQSPIVWDEAVVPMRPGTATILYFGSIENEGTKHLLETWCHCGRELPVDCE